MQEVIDLRDAKMSENREILERHVEPLLRLPVAENEIGVLRLGELAKGLRSLAVPFPVSEIEFLLRIIFRVGELLQTVNELYDRPIAFFLSSTSSSSTLPIPLSVRFRSR